MVEVTRKKENEGMAITKEDAKKRKKNQHGKSKKKKEKKERKTSQ